MVIVALLGLLTGFILGVWLAQKQWAFNATDHPRKKYGGRFYWVVEDGDNSKLAHINKCFGRL